MERAVNSATFFACSRFALARAAARRYPSCSEMALLTSITSARRSGFAAALCLSSGLAALAAEERAAAFPPSGAPWLLHALNGAAVLGFACWWWWQLREPGAEGPDASLALVAFDPAAASEWKARALAAEARADKAAALLQTRLMPQLARWMMNELIQRLLHQRTDLMTSQQRAEQEVSELERRLEKLHAPLEDRLKAYEQRIAELERDLAAKGAENRELIQARIESARQKLASERAKTPVSWN